MSHEYSPPLSLSENQLQEFRENGVLVIEGVLSEAEVLHARTAFHQHIATLGIDHDAILSKSDTKSIPPVRIKSPVSRIFYSDWKLLNVHLHPRVCQLAQDLIVATYGSGTDVDFIHPFPAFTNVKAYVDRVCYRLPDIIREEGGLGLHMDRDPLDPYLFKKVGKEQQQTKHKSNKLERQQNTPNAAEALSGLTKWRPIQAFVALTDHYSGDSGGLRVVPGFHRHIDSYFKGKTSDAHGGEFYRMNSIQHETLISQCQPVIAPAGSLVLWDTRLPHATSAKLAGHDSREVVYVGFLPTTPLNNEYLKKQLQAIRLNKPPPAYDDGDESEISDCNWKETALTALQKSMLGISD